MIPATARISASGIYDMPAADYHADPVVDPSLSSSIAELLINATPRHAWHAHPRLNPEHEERSSAAMDLGSVAHEIVLGKGGGYAVSPYDTYASKEARAWRDAMITDGRTPVKEADYEIAVARAVSIRRCLDATPGADLIFRQGTAEAVVVWRDVGGPMCRAMLDWLDGPIIADLKTTSTGLSDRALAAKIGDGLDMKAAFHLRGLEHVRPELAGRTKWLWVFAETKPPFEARVFEMTGQMRHYGDHKAAYAIELWRQCVARNEWPGYPREIVRADYPTRASEQWDAREGYDDIALRMRPLETPVRTNGRMLAEIVP